jgi:hypothetical protein
LSWENGKPGSTGELMSPALSQVVIPDFWVWLWVKVKPFNLWIDANWGKEHERST